MKFLGIVGCFIALAAPVVQPQEQTSRQLALDVMKPIVYIQFDHAGLREQVEAGESVQGYWLRLINNSVIPIEVTTFDTATKAKLIIVPDVISPILRKIPKSETFDKKMPMGYADHMGGKQRIMPGKDLVFSVPANHVSPYWFMQVPFQLSLPPIKEGEQPTCLAAFYWEDLPESVRSKSGR